MRRRGCTIALALALVGGWLAANLHGAGRVELDVVAEREAPPVASQTWARELGEAGIRSVRFRQQRTMDRPGIAVRGPKDSPVYVVTGVLDSRGEIVLPGGRYRSGQSRRIAAWLDELARLGPPESREPVVAFGLSRSQMATVRDDLARPINFSTSGEHRADVIRRILAQITLPVRMDEKLLPRTAENDRVEDELRGLAAGTSLAAALRGAGLAIVPRMGSMGPECLIDAARGQREVWPVGRKPEGRVTQFLPKLFEPLTISLTDIPASDVIREIGKRVAAPVVIDHAALARHGVDLGKRVNVPRTRTTYADALDRALFQIQTKWELRADDGGRPLLWVTTMKR